MKTLKNEIQTHASKDWLIHGGNIGELIRSVDWSLTPLGPRADWPYPLRVITNIALSNTFPMAILWGKEFIFVYNAAYSVLADDRHPRAMGKSTREIWPEVWDLNKPIFEKVMQEGQTVYLEDQLFKINRRGKMEKAYFTLSYSPIWLNHDLVGGTLVTLIETTDRVRLENELRQSQTTLQSFFDSTPLMAGIDELDGNRTIAVAGNEKVAGFLGRHPEDLPGNTGNELGNPQEFESLWVESYRRCQREGKLVQFDYEYLLGPEKRCLHATASFIGIGPTGNPRFSFVVEDLTERKRTEKKLVESENRYRSLVEDQVEFVSRFKADGTFLFVNEGFCSYFGKSKEELVGSKWRPLAHPDDLPIIYKKLSELSPEKPIVMIKNRVVNAKGEFSWVRFSNRAFFDEKGKIQEIQSVGRDINDIEQAQNQIRHQAELLKTILDNIPAMIFFFDDKGNFRWMNSCAEKTLGWTKDEGLQIDLLAECYPDPEYRKFVLEYISSAQKEVWTEFETTARDGRIIHTLFSNVLLEEGSNIGIGIDISEREQRKKEARSAEKRYRSLFDNMTQGAFIQKSDGSLIDVNPAALMMFGLTRDEFLGRTSGHSCWVFIQEDGTPLPDHEHPSIKALATGKNLNGVVAGVFNPQSKSRVWMEINAIPEFMNDETKPYQVLVTLHDITDRKRSEKILHESEERLRLVMEGSHLGYWDWNIETGEVQRNVRWAEMLGYSLEEIEFTVKQWTDLHHPDDCETAWKSLKDHLEGKTSEHRIEYRMRAKDGQYKWILDQASVVKRDAQGKPIRMSGTHTDITERKETERLLRESEKKYKELLQMAKSAILRWNVDGTLTFFNKYAQTLFGYHEDEVIGKSVNILVPESESTGKDLRTLVMDIAKNPEQYVKNINENVCSDGRRVWMAWTNTPIFDEKGIVSEILAVGMNITELKLAQDELAESLERHRNLFEAIADAVLFIDKGTGRIMDANTTTFHLFGYTKNELFSLNLTDLSAEPEKTLESLKKGETYIPQRLYRKKDGTTFPVEIVAREFIWKEEQVRIVSIRDITSRIMAEEEKKKLEESLHQAQKLESVGRLAGGVAHDFNNMLGVILGYGEILLNELHPDDPMREDINQIVEAGHRSANLTRQLLAFSRKQKLRPEILDLNMVIKNLEKMLRRIIGEDIKLQLQLSESIDSILADPGQIEQVIMNLAVNARDAMPLGGNLTIETMNTLLDEFYSEEHIGVKPGKYVQMTISDTGIGMEKSVLPYIFEPFFTTKEKEKGTGLGLSTVYGIVKQSGGNIWCYSEPNQGTTFKIYLPQVDFESETKSDDSEWNLSQERMGNRELILVVEDDTHLRKLCEKMLSRFGYKVIVASNAGEALLLIEEEGIHPDLVITDVVMPGISGKSLADRLKKSRPDLKILFMSGYTDDAIVHHGVLDPGAFFIEKPFSSESLAKKVHDILLNKQPE